MDSITLAVADSLAPIACSGRIRSGLLGVLSSRREPSAVTSEHSEVFCEPHQRVVSG